MVFNEIKFSSVAAGTVFNLLLFLIDYTQAGNLVVLVTLHLQCSGVHYSYIIVTFQN